MYGTFVLLDEAGKIQKGERAYLRDLENKDERWLRDTLLANPEIIPLDDIDPTFGPLVPLCKELRTDAGPIDAVFINAHGRLTIVECKLWKNPQARREVVAQTLDYVSALAGWSYADLQRQVSAATGKKGNVPFEAVQLCTDRRIKEQEFVDAVSRSLRDGRFLVLIVGDGIREGIQSLTALVNRNAAKAFTFALVEVALYHFGENRFAIQPRVLAETETVRRQITVMNINGNAHPIIVEDTDNETDDESDAPKKRGSSGSKEHLKAWWQPVLRMNFDDPLQEPPFWVVTNNAVLKTPFPGIRIKALAIVNSPQIGVFVSGRQTNLAAIRHHFQRERSALLKELPDGTVIQTDNRWPIVIDNFDLASDDERRAWIVKTMNTFANVLCPRLRKWYEEMQESSA